MEETRSRSNYDKEAADLKLPPYSIEAEQSVLGSLMLDKIGRASCRERV